MIARSHRQTCTRVALVAFVPLLSGFALHAQTPRAAQAPTAAAARTLYVPDWTTSIPTPAATNSYRHRQKGPAGADRLRPGCIKPPS